jgi:hypothetical protein
MFTLIAIESHEEEGHAAPERPEPEGNTAPPLSTAEPHGAQ